MINNSIIMNILIVIIIILVVVYIYKYLKHDNKKNIDPKIQKFLNKLSGPPIYTLTPSNAKQVLDNLQTPLINSPTVNITDIAIPTGPQNYIKVRIVRPINNSSLLPIALYFHGGGWVMGNEQTHDHLIRQLATDAQVAIVFISYTPSPEAQYPQPIKEAYFASKYIIDNACQYNLDNSRIAAIGDSVGGNMATVVTMLYNNDSDNENKINLQMLFYPVTSANFNTNSYKEFANGPWLTKKNMEWFWSKYLPNKEMRKEPGASPLNAPLYLLKNMPKTLIITDENDVLRDEGEAYAKKLSKAGVNVTLTRYDGTIHDFMMLNGLNGTKQTKDAIEQASNFMKDAFI